MTIRSVLSRWRYLASLLFTVAMLTGGTWFVAKATSDYLLYESATRSARNWAQFLVANVGDLEQIAAGETPSLASAAFFAATRNSSDVFRYTIFNRYGYSVQVTSDGEIGRVSLTDYVPTAARAAKEDRSFVDAKEERALGKPAYVAEAYIPVQVGSRPVAVVGAYLDQTAERNSFYRTFLVAGVSLCMLTGVSFGVPAIGWYRRTREKQQADRRIQFLAHHDVLTGLPNRVRLIERLEATLVGLPAKGGIAAVYYVDVDYFKQVNDTLGHDAGDFVLGSIGKRLRSIVRVEDLVARLGGDEFVVVQSGFSDKDQVEDFARRFIDVLRVPIFFKGYQIDLTVTVGAAVAPADGATAERLLKSADLALYAGKAAGRNCIRFFTADMDAALQKRVGLEKIIRNAIAHNGFVLYYQPVFAMVGHRLIGFEALVRLPAPDGTLLRPAEFLPLADELKLTDKIGAWVMLEACRTAKSWPGALTVAVNLSPLQFESGTVEACVVAALETTGLEPSRLELEINEAAFLGNSEATLATLKRLKEIGLSVVMDDFGTGYSSLSYLWRFPFDKIKIDQSFIGGYGEAGRNVEAVIRSILALGRELNMRVTVEGVESADQVNFLYNARADEVQGFYFGRPESRKDIIDDIRKQFPESGAGDGVKRPPG